MWGISLPRSLPQIDCNSVRYQIYILHRILVENMLLGSISEPRHWLGHPVPAMIKGSEGVGSYPELESDGSKWVWAVGRISTLGY